MQAKLMLGGFEKAFNRPTLTPQADEIRTRVRIAGGDKAQFSFAIGAFEPKPGDGEGIVEVCELHLKTALGGTVEVFEAPPISQSAIAA
jgi:hypothetical protein